MSRGRARRRRSEDRARGGRRRARSSILPRVPESGSQLYERERELAALAQALDAAVAGAPRLVLVEGPAGAGKSRLLAAARNAAAARGLPLLAAHGVELERAFPFGLARQLVEPLLAAADPAERERLLSGPAGLAAPLLGFPVADAGGTAGGDAGAVSGGGAAGGALLGDDRRLALAHGLRWLLANATRERPAALLVDDAHWGDEPSLALLAALAARLDLPLALIVALRPGEPGAPEPLDRLRAAPAAVLLRPAPLGRDGVARLLAARLPQAEPAFADACATASGGNPFLLVELTEAVVAGALEPTAAAAEQVAELVPETVLRATLLRLRALPPAAVALARAAAILGERATLRRAAELAGVGERSRGGLAPPRDPRESAGPGDQQLHADPMRMAASEAADALAAAHLLAPGEPLRFVHPLVAATVRAELPAHQRGALHARAAELLTRDGEPAATVAAQLLHAPPGSWERAGETLVAAARAALRDGDDAVGRRLLARALEEPLTPAGRAEAEIAAAFAEVARGASPTSPRLDAALRHVRAPEVRAEAHRAVALHAYVRGDFEQTLTAIERALAELAPSDPAALSLRDLRVAAAALAPARVAGRERLLREVASAEAPGPIALGVLAAAVAAGGAAPAQVRAVAERIPLELVARDALPGSIAVAFALTALLWCDELALAERILDATLPAAQRAGSLTAFGSFSHLRAHVRLRQGRLAEAIADGQQPLGLGDDGWESYRGWTSARVAQAHLERGELERAAELVALGLGGDADQLEHALVLEVAGELALARGDAAAALDHQLAAGRHVERWQLHHPGVVTWQANAARAAWQLGDRQRARELADAAHAAATAAGEPPRPLARALRVAAIVGDEPAQAERAVARLRPTGLRLELAHALADLGALRRGRGEPLAAREPLREALALAERCDARPLAARAHAELRATGGRRVRGRPHSGREALTPTEARVAALVAEGRSNGEVAALLFVTVKTVEWHLGRVYRKLGITARAELPSALGDAPSPG